jgi:pimeloyl-ACP methyl ester carboxylesterase
VTSLTSILSSSGNSSPRIALDARRAVQAIASRPADPNRVEAVVDHFVRVFGVTRSPGFPTQVDSFKREIERGERRGLHPHGTTRQLLAILASDDRRAWIWKITAPTLVFHGADDPLVPVAAGCDPAAHTRGAKLEITAGMGHDSAPALQQRLVELIAAHGRVVTPQAPAATQELPVVPTTVA